MHTVLRFGLLVALLAVAVWWTWRRDGAMRPVPALWAFWTNLRLAVTGRRAWWAVAAVISTVLLVVTGWDRALQDLWQTLDPLDPGLLWKVLRVGEYWTLAVALVLLLIGVVGSYARFRLGGALALQAVLAGLVVSQALKALTGRLGPLHPGDDRVAPFPMTRDADAFAFDVWNRVAGDGRFFWPSGHTMSAMVLVTALVACFPERRWLPWVGYPLVLFMALAMVDGDFHWTSDVVAALLLGWPLGWTLGRRFCSEHERRLDVGR